MTSREKFEAWMTAEQWFHGSDFEWDERRNCYAQFGIHLAYKAFMAAEGAAEQKLTDMAVQLANTESKCRELAAERDIVNGDNAYLRDLVICWARECDRITFAHTNKITDAHQMEAEQELANTYPASSAFLAEVRAQGVEMYAEHLTRKAIESGENKKHAYAYLAANLAAQLRKGAAL